MAQINNDQRQAGRLSTPASFVLYMGRKELVALFEIGKLTNLPLGWQNENKSRTLQIDVGAWLTDWPGAAINVLVRRPEEDTFYPANTKVQDNLLTWTLTRGDLEIAGTGRAQFILTDENDVELRSRVVQTIIGESLSGTTADAPQPEDAWLHEVLQAAQDAEQAVEKMPYINDAGYWMLWDSEAGSFRDSGVRAEGLDGEKGERGAMITNVYVKEKPIFNGQGGRRYYMIDVDGVPAYGFEVYDGQKGDKGDQGDQGLPGTGIYIVTVTRNAEGRPYADKTQEEIREAVSQGQTCVLLLDGRVYTYKGEMYETSERAETPTFVAPAEYDKTAAMIYYRRAHVSSTQYVAMLANTFPLPTAPEMRLESNQYGLPQWMPKVAETVIYPDTALSYFPDDGAFLITTPWEKTITAGGLYTVKYNGAEYDCRAVTMDNGVLVLGKASQLGLPGGNEDAPFAMMVIITDTPDYTADGLPIYGAVMPLDGATELTLGITYKERDQITLIVGTDGTVTSDTPFEKAWTMTDAELAAAIAVQDTGTYYGMQSDFYSSVSVRRLTAPNGYKWLQIAYVKLVDHGDLPGQADVTRYIDWIETAITLSGHQTQSLPDMTNLADKGKYYMCCINGAWVHRSLDDLKADLGLA